jgi:hypothetical protein
MQMIVIDGQTFDIPIVEEGRQADMLYKSAERDEAGFLHSELIGVYYNFKGMKFGNITDTVLYTAFYAKLTEAVDSHTVILPIQTGALVSEEVYFANIKDALRHDKDGVAYWKDLTIDIIAVGPARVP